MEEMNYEGNQNWNPESVQSAPEVNQELPSALVQKRRLPFDKTDKLFTLIYFLVGYAFIYTFTSRNFERNLALFTIFYAAAGLVYCRQKKIKPVSESYVWLAVMLSLGIPYAFWTVFDGLQVTALILVAAYWTISISGRLLQDGKTSNLLFFDGLNALFVIPFGNFGCQFRVLFSKNEEKGKENYLLSVLLGAAIALPALLIVLPLLSKADAGFENMISSFMDYISQHMLDTFLRILFAIPVSCYLYGLIFGSLNGRNTNCMDAKALRNSGKSVRFLPEIAVGTALGILCFVYAAFIGIQGNYMFSAFAGSLPEEFTYAEYARRGFFELCKVGAWNLVILWSLGLFAKKERRENKIFRVMAVCISVLTLLIIATAMSKMAMYIVVYGLTVKRILTMVFMIWMAVVFVCIIVQQKKEIALARICILIGAGLFSLLCIFPIEQWIELYNKAFFP